MSEQITIKFYDFNNANLLFQVFCFSKWKYVPGTALFFEPKKVAKTTESLYDKTCETELKYIGSTRKCLEMTRKDIIEK